MIGCPVAAACLDACWLGELSQHPMCPHSAHLRRLNHQPFGDARHSTHPSPLGFEEGLIPCRPFFTYDIPFLSSVRKMMSIHHARGSGPHQYFAGGRFWIWVLLINTSGPPYWCTTTAFIFHLLYMAGKQPLTKVRGRKRELVAESMESRNGKSPG